MNSTNESKLIHDLETELNSTNKSNLINLEEHKTEALPFEYQTATEREVLRRRGEPWRDRIEENKHNKMEKQADQNKNRHNLKNA